jgi:DNA-binding transcriptional MocR family regulator
MVEKVLSAELGDKNILKWRQPNGGYFVSIDTLDGCAKRIVQMAAEGGVKLTPAGATFPYGNDPRDRNIRIAPTFPPIDQVNQAMELVAICVQLASIDKLIEKK